MKPVPLVKSVMTPFPHSIDVDDTVENASKMMAEHDIHHLPVTERGKPLGVVTDRAVNRLLAERAAHSGGGSHSRDGSPRVRDVANFDILVVDLLAPLDGVVMEMARQRLTTALVVREERLVGILTAGDVFTYLGKLLGALFPRGSGDAA
jgi:CBS domain-containing protein